jgi:hypothetical protein
MPFIYIGAMNMRGIRAPKPNHDIITLNVTSCQSKNMLERIELSPMSEIKGGYKGYYCFENYWQSGKVFENTNFVEYQNWWKHQTSGKRKNPKMKNKNVVYSNYDGTQRDYITSRKEIYTKEYYNLIKNTNTIKKWQNIAKNNDIIVYDLDGPRNNDKEPITLKITKKLLKEKINDLTFPFGHGYIVAGILAGYIPNDYI